MVAVTHTMIALWDCCRKHIHPTCKSRSTLLQTYPIVRRILNFLFTPSAKGQSFPSVFLRTLNILFFAFSCHTKDALIVTRYERLGVSTRGYASFIMTCCSLLTLLASDRSFIVDGRDSSYNS